MWKREPENRSFDQIFFLDGPLVLLYCLIYLTFCRFRYLYEREDVVGLEIRQITVEDEGEYKCVAVNKYGRAESRCEILVNGMLLFIYLLYVTV